MERGKKNSKNLKPHHPFTTKYIKINSKFFRFSLENSLIFQNFLLMKIECSNKTNKQKKKFVILAFSPGLEKL